MLFETVGFYFSCATLQGRWQNPPQRREQRWTLQLLHPPRRLCLTTAQPLLRRKRRQMMAMAAMCSSAARPTPRMLTRTTRTTPMWTWRRSVMTR